MMEEKEEEVVEEKVLEEEDEVQEKGYCIDRFCENATNWLSNRLIKIVWNQDMPKFKV